MTASLHDCLAHLLEVLGTLGELDSSEGDEFFRRDAEILSRGEVGSLRDVEGEERVDAVNHVVGRVARRFTDSYTFSPEDLWEDLSPLRFVSLASLHDGFANVEVLRFDDTVCS